MDLPAPQAGSLCRLDGKRRRRGLLSATGTNQQGGEGGGAAVLGPSLSELALHHSGVLFPRSLGEEPCSQKAGSKQRSPRSVPWPARRRTSWLALSATRRLRGVEISSVAGKILGRGLRRAEHLVGEKSSTSVMRGHKVCLVTNYRVDYLRHFNSRNTSPSFLFNQSITFFLCFRCCKFCLTTVFSVCLKVPGARLGEKVNDFWSPGTALLANPDHFLNSLVNYDKENMSEDIIKKLKGYIENPEFQPSFVVKVGW